jgi:hypothetical protein
MHVSINSAAGSDVGISKRSGGMGGGWSACIWAAEERRLVSMSMPSFGGVKALRRGQR